MTENNKKTSKKVTAKSLIEKGKKQGALTLAEIMEAFSETELDKDQVENLYETLGNLGIEVIEDKAPKVEIDFNASDDLELGESKYLERTIVFSDMLEQPSAWYNYSNAYYYLGNYSVPKHELMIRVLKLLQNSDSRVDEEWISKGNSDPTIFVYWRSKFVEELNTFNNNPENIASGVAPLREDPNNPSSALVTFPTKVQ